MIASPERDISSCCCDSEDTINQVPQQVVLMTVITRLLHRQWNQTAWTLALFMGRIGNRSTHATLELLVHVVYVCISSHFNTKHHIPAVSSW